MQGEKEAAARVTLLRKKQFFDFYFISITDPTEKADHWTREGKGRGGSLWYYITYILFEEKKQYLGPCPPKTRAKKKLPHSSVRLNK